MGNSTREPVSRALPSGSMVCEFGIAVNRRFRTSQGEDREEACFVECFAYAKLADIIQRFVHRGTPVLLEGRLSYDQWVDKNTGMNRSRLRVLVENMQLIGGRNDGQAQGGYQQGGYGQAQGGYQQGGYGQAQGGYQQGGYGQAQGGYQQGGYGQPQGGYGQQGGFGQQGGYGQAQGGYQQPSYRQAPPPPPPFEPPAAVVDEPAGAESAAPQDNAAQSGVPSDDVKAAPAEGAAPQSESVADDLPF